MDGRFRESGRVKVWTVVWCAMIVGFVGAVMYPVFMRATEIGGPSCQSNLNQVGKAIKSYMTDWDDTFPTNRLNIGEKPLCYHVALSRRDGANGDKPKLFASGLNWVDSLYSYVEKVGRPDDNESVWTCPAEKHVSPDKGRVSYALNYNLLEVQWSSIRNPASTMLLRELGRTADAECRPVNLSDGPDHRPVGAFLTDIDPYLGKCNPVPHMHGSNILFADGHVKSFNREGMPTDDNLVYDKKTKQWWNGAGKTIAITP